MGSSTPPVSPSQAPQPQSQTLSSSTPPIELASIPTATQSPAVTPSANLVGLSSLSSRPLSETSTASITVGQERRASLTNHAANPPSSLPRRLSRTLREADLPRGFFAATADLTSSVVAASQRPRSGTLRTRSSTGASDMSPAVQSPADSLAQPPPANLTTLAEQHTEQHTEQHAAPDDDDDTIVNRGAVTSSSSADAQKEGVTAAPPVDLGLLADGAVDADDADADDATDGRAPDGSALYDDYANGYHFPPRYTRKESFNHGLLAFWHYLLTPVGFLVVLYGANIIAWGGMLFLLLCNASKPMCYPTCDDINSPRRKWIEIDSQILTGLFCVTAFGLAPWRFRDLYFYLQYKLRKGVESERGLRCLAGVNRGWMRLPGSDALPISTGPGHIPADTPAHAVPIPETKIPDAPLTGRRAPPTREGAIVFVIGMNIANTLLQVVLCGFMWGMNRYDRPSWSTGLFVALGCIAGALGGLGTFFEGKRVKGIEGVPLTDADRQRLAADRARGVYHYNNLSGKKPKASAEPDLEAGK